LEILRARGRVGLASTIAVPITTNKFVIAFFARRATSRALSVLDSRTTGGNILLVTTTAATHTDSIAVVGARRLSKGSCNTGRALLANSVGGRSTSL